MNKTFAFDYMLTLLEKWHKEITGREDGFEQHSKLSILKLLFLTAAPKEEGGPDLLGTFDHFCALPYGPVESEIYDNIKKDKLPSFSISERNIKRKENIALPYDIVDFNDVKNAVEELKTKNNQLVLFNAFRLVEITHKWESWKTAFDFAQFMEIQSYEMSSDSIRKDRNKFFGKM